MSPYVISTISTFFPTLQTPTLRSLSFSSRPFTRYQEQDLLVVNFGLLRAISTISTIPTIPTISLPPPELLYDLSQCSLQPREHLTNSLEIANSLLQHLNSKSYWWLHHWDYPPWPPEGSQCWILCVGRKVFQHNIVEIDCCKGDLSLWCPSKESALRFAPVTGYSTGNSLGLPSQQFWHFQCSWCVSGLLGLLTVCGPEE